MFFDKNFKHKKKRKTKRRSTIDVSMELGSCVKCQCAQLGWRTCTPDCISFQCSVCGQIRVFP